MKYAALFLNVLGLLILGWMFSILTQKSLTHRLPPRLEETPVTQVSTTQKDVDTAQSLLSMADHLSREMHPPTLISLGPVIAQPVAASGNSDRYIPPQRVLSLLLEGKDGPRATIDGQLVREGDALPHAGRVTRIEPDRVIITEAHGKQTLRVPVEQIRIGSLYTKRTPALNDQTAASTSPSGSLASALPVVLSSTSATATGSHTRSTHLLPSSPSVAPSHRP